MTVSAGVIGNAQNAAVITSFNAAAKIRRSAVYKIGYNFSVLRP
jgi:hypothetical protein